MSPILILIVLLIVTGSAVFFVKKQAEAKTEALIEDIIDETVADILDEPVVDPVDSAAALGRSRRVGNSAVRAKVSRAVRRAARKSRR